MRAQDSPEADGCTAGKQGAQKAAAADAAHKNGGGGANGKAAQNGAAGGGGGDALDRFGCDVQEAAELGSYQRVMLEGRMSPDEAVWQWCADGGEIDPDKLRKMWEFLGDAASQCSDRQQQPMYLNMLTVLLEVRCPADGWLPACARAVPMRPGRARTCCSLRNQCVLCRAQQGAHVLLCATAAARRHRQVSLRRLGAAVCS